MSLVRISDREQNKPDVIKKAKDPKEVIFEIGSRDSRVEVDRFANDHVRGSVVKVLESAILEEGISVDPASKETTIDLLMEIRDSVVAVKKRFVEIGKCLLRIYRTDEQLYHAITKKGSALLGFDGSYAIKYKRIAEIVEEGLIQQNELPPHITVAYEICSIEKAHFQSAREEGLIHPSVKRREALQFKSRLKRMVENDGFDFILEIRRLESQKKRMMEKAEKQVAMLDRKISRLKKLAVEQAK